TERACEELIMKTFSFVIFVTLPFWPVAAAAQLNVLISGGFSGAYEQLLPEFERTSGIKVTTGSGASQGTGPQTIAAQLARGVPAERGAKRQFIKLASTILRPGTSHIPRRIRQTCRFAYWSWRFFRKIGRPPRRLHLSHNEYAFRARTHRS